MGKNPCAYPKSSVMTQNKVIMFGDPWRPSHVILQEYAECLKMLLVRIAEIILSGIVQSQWIQCKNWMFLLCNNRI